MENLRTWKVIRDELDELVANDDLKLTTAPEYVIGSLCKALMKSGLLVEVDPPPAPEGEDTH